MKVLHLSTESSWRGGEQQMALLLQELNARGVENQVVARPQSAFAKYCSRQDLPCVYLPFRGGTFDWVTHRGLKALMKKGAFDVVHVHTGRGLGHAVCAHFFARTDVPLVVSRRTAQTPRHNFFTRWKYNYAGIRQWVAVSDAVRRVLQGYLRVPEKAVTIHSGIDPLRFAINSRPTGLRQRYGLHRRIPLIGMSSALVPGKGHVAFLAMAAILIRQGLDARFVVLGEGPLLAEFRKQARLWAISDRVFFEGFVPELEEVLPELDVFVMPSEEEGLGTAVLDAFAARVPVVATRAGGIPEMVVHEETGLLAGVDDAEELAVQVMRILGDYDFREGILQRAEEKLRTQFWHQSMAQQTFQVYQQVMI